MGLSQNFGETELRIWITKLKPLKPFKKKKNKIFTKEIIDNFYKGYKFQ